MATWAIVKKLGCQQNFRDVGICWRVQSRGCDSHTGGNWTNEQLYTIHQNVTCYQKFYIHTGQRSRVDCWRKTFFFIVLSSSSPWQEYTTGKTPQAVRVGSITKKQRNLNSGLQWFFFLLLLLSQASLLLLYLGNFAEVILSSSRYFLMLYCWPSRELHLTWLCRRRFPSALSARDCATRCQECTHTCAAFHYRRPQYEKRPSIFLKIFLHAKCQSTLISKIN